MRQIVESLDLIGASILGVTVIVFCLCCIVVFIVGTFRFSRSMRKPPCQHNLVVCDYKETYDDGYDINKHYYVACTKCGTTNWVEERYLKGMSALGLYKEGERYD